MTALSIHLPEKLAKASKKVAHDLGVSRAQFIRQAVLHELQNFYAKREREAMANSFAKMRKNATYMKEAQSLDHEFDYDFPKEKDAWWTGKKS